MSIDFPNIHKGSTGNQGCDYMNLDVNYGPRANVVQNFSPYPFPEAQSVLSLKLPTMVLLSFSWQSVQRAVDFTLTCI